MSLVLSRYGMVVIWCAMCIKTIEHRVGRCVLQKFTNDPIGVRQGESYDSAHFCMSSSREPAVKHCGGALAIARLANAEIVMMGGIELPPMEEA